jgi:hypothetical protein
MGRRFGSMMTAWSVGRPRYMDEGYYPIQERLIEGSKQDDDAVFLIDIAGGRGHDLEGLKQAHPNIRGKLILQDRPEVISLVELSPGLEKMTHDFNTPQPIKGTKHYEVLPSTAKHNSIPSNAPNAFFLIPPANPFHSLS